MNVVFIKTLGLTLFHSIWQATLIALIMSLILSIVKKKYAKERYLVALTSLLILFIVSIYTFYSLYQIAEPTTTLTGLAEISQYNNITIVANEQSLLFTVKSVLLNNIQWITLLWGVGMCFFLLKIVYGLNKVSLLARTSRKIENDWINNILEQLKDKANLKRVIALRESLKIIQPSIIGFLKPIIYFPIGLVNSLSPEQAEAILAHELAHIVRNDFIINIIQSILETFYYFHPAVWWISANIRNERENACDDLAIEIIGDRIRYAKSLLLLQENTSSQKLALAMTLSTRKSPLFLRMKRILNQPKNTHDMKQKLLASLILMSSIIWISATDVQDQKEIEISPIPEMKILEEIAPPVALDTIPKKSKKSQSTIVEIKDGEIKRLNIDGQEIPEEEFEEHSIIIDDLKEGNSWQFDTSFFDRFDDLEDMDFDRFDSVWTHIDVPHHDFHFDFHNLDTFRFHMDSMRFNMDSIRWRMKDFQHELGELGHEFGHFMDSFDFSSIGSDLRFYFDSLNTFDFDDMDHGFYFGRSYNLEGAFIEELKEDGLHKEGLNDIKLSDSGLEINGTIQSEEMHRKYLKIYERKTGVELGEGSTINMQVTDNSLGGKMKRL